MIKTQLLRPNTCKCVIMQKWDTDNPEIIEYVTKQEYLALMEPLIGQPNIHTRNDINKFADRITVCEKHSVYGQTKNMMEQVLMENRIENEKNVALLEVKKQAEDEAKRLEIENIVRQIIAEK